MNKREILIDTPEFGVEIDIEDRWIEIHSNFEVFMNNPTEFSLEQKIEFLNEDIKLKNRIKTVIESKIQELQTEEQTEEVKTKIEGLEACVFEMKTFINQHKLEQELLRQFNYPDKDLAELIYTKISDNGFTADKDDLSDFMSNLMLDFVSDYQVNSGFCSDIGF